MAARSLPTESSAPVGSALAEVEAIGTAAAAAEDGVLMQGSATTGERGLGEAGSGEAGSGEGVLSGASDGVAM